MGLLFEIRKLIKDKSFIITLIFMLISSIMLFELDLSLSDNMQLSQNNIYQSVLELYTSAEDKDIREELTLFNQINDSFKAGLSITVVESSYGKELIEEYNEILSNNGENFFKYSLTALKQIEMLEVLGDYNNYNRQVLEETEQLLDRTSAKNNPSRYKYLSELKVVYENLTDVDIKSTSSLAVDAYVSSNYRDIISIFFVLFVVYNLQSNDREADMLDVLSLSKSGKKQLTINKLATLVISLAVFVLLNEILVILYTMLRFGSFDWLTSIQSFTSLISSPFNINLMQMLILGYVIKLLALSVIGLLFFVIISLFEQKNIGMVVSVIIVSLFAFIFYFISDASYLRNLRYINLYGFLMIYTLFKNFIYLHIGFLSTLWFNIIIILSIILILGLSLLAYIIFANYEGLFKVKFKPKYRFKKVYRSLSLFYHEFIKSFVMEGALLVIIIVCSIIVLINYNYKSEPISSYTNNINDYINLHGGEIDEEMYAFFNEEYTYYAGLVSEHEKVVVAYNNGEISDEDYQLHLEEYFKNNSEILVFNNVYDRLLKSENYLIVKDGYNQITAQYNYSLDHLFAVTIMVFLIVIISNFYVIDANKHEFVLYDISSRGFKERSLMKLVHTLLVTLAIFIFTYGLYYFVVSSKYPLNFNNITMYNIIDIDVNSIGFKNNPALQAYSISNYLLLVHFARLVGYLLISTIALIVSKHIKERPIVILILCLLFVVPGLLYVIGFESFYYLTIFDLISGNMYFRYNGDFIKMLISVFLLVLSLTYYFVITLKSKKN